MSTRDAMSTAPAKEQFPNLAQDVRNFPVREGEVAWELEEIEALADELITENGRLHDELVSADHELSDLLRNSGDGAGDDQADSGSSALEREQELTLVNNTRDLLEQNARALARIGAGTYAACESCGEAIGKARLQAFPRATLCVVCKQREERR